MKLTQIILQKTITGVVREGTEEFPDGSLTEEYAVNNADKLWEELVKTSAIVLEDTEFLAMNPADWSCPGCLSDLKVTGKAAQVSITLADNAQRPLLEYGDFLEPKLVCSQSCGYELSEEEQASRLEKLIK